MSSVSIFATSKDSPSVRPTWEVKLITTVSCKGLYIGKLQLI